MGDVKKRTMIELNSKDIFLPEGSKNLWTIDKGKINVFCVIIEPDGSFGRRNWLFTLECGDILIGFDYKGNEKYKIIALAHPYATLAKDSVEYLREDIADKDKLLEKAKLLQRWAENLTFALMGEKLPPKDLKFIEEGENIQLSLLGSYGARPGKVLWLKLVKGEAEAISSYMAYFKGHYGYFPVTNRFWFKFYNESSTGDEAGCDPEVCSYSSEEFLKFTGIAESIVSFHAIFLWMLFEKTENFFFGEDARLKKKIEYDSKLFSQSLTDFVSIVNGDDDETIIKISGGEALFNVCELVGSAAGINVVIPAYLKKADSKLEPISEIARASMVRHRKVILRDEWWTKDAGPIVAFRDGAQPVALIPRSAFEYEIHDPEKGIVSKVTAKIAAELTGIGYVFYRPLPNRALTLRDISIYSIKCQIIPDVLMMLFAGIVLSLINMIIPIATNIAFDSIIPDVERSQMVQMTLILISSAVCVFLFQFVRSMATLRVETKIDASLQAAVWDRLLSLPAPFFRKFSTGDLAMRAMSINTIRQTISGTVLNSVMSGVFTVFNFFLLFYYNFKLAGMAVLMTFIAVVFYLVTMLIQLKFSKIAMRLDGELSSLIFALINGVAKFRVAGAESRAFNLWAKLFKKKKEIKVYMISNVTAVFNTVYSLVCSGVFFWWIINYASDDPMSTGSFVAFNSAFSTFFSGMVQISSSMMALLNVFTMYERAKPILETVPEFDEAKEDPGELNGAVEISRATFRYAPELPPVLKDVSISVKPGEFVAVVGPSGSGKSTLIRLLLGFDKPEVGTILYDSHDLASVDIRAIRRQIGVVLQNGQLMVGTILSNISGSSNVGVEEVWEAARSAGMADDIEAMPMGLHTMISEGAGSVSGGQKQRILIARALVKKPRIIIFDEATSALDNIAQSAVSDSLEKLHATRIVIAHRLSTIIKADKIFVVENGAVVESGNYEQLIKNDGLFRKLAERQLA